MRRSKLYKEQAGLIDDGSYYSIEDAIGILKKMPHPKFDETVDLVFRLGIDPRQSDQVVRGALALPHGTGKKVRVVVIASGSAAEEAKTAGADEVGFEDLLEKIKNGWLNFDTMVATPSAMQKVRTLGKLLGPRGLMPNPKTGTVTDDVGKAVREVKAGRVEFRADRSGCVHLPIGKLSFDKNALSENATTSVQAILRVRPPTAKGIYMLSCTLSATMSPGLKIAAQELTRI